MIKKKKNNPSDLRYMSIEEKCKRYNYRQDVMSAECLDKMKVCSNGGHNRKPDTVILNLYSRRSKGKKT